MVIDQLIASQTILHGQLGNQLIYISRKINESGNVRGAKQLFQDEPVLRKSEAVTQACDTAVKQFVGIKFGKIRYHADLEATNPIESKNRFGEHPKKSINNTCRTGAWNLSLQLKSAETQPLYARQSQSQ